MVGELHWDGEWEMGRQGICGGKETEYRLLKQIVEQYVFKNCDYLICLNGSNGSYTMFYRKEGLAAMPPSRGEDYRAVVRSCVESYVAPEDRNRVLKEMEPEGLWEALDREGVHTVSYGVETPEGDYARKLMECVYCNADSRQVLLMRKDITMEYRGEQRQKEQLMTALENARRDSLTGLCNRQEVRRQVNLVLEQDRGQWSVLFFIDLDNFKMVNDTLGHRWGDRVLQRVAEVFHETLGDAGMIGRVGGDEFAAFLTGLGSREAAETWARRLCCSVSGIRDFGIDELAVTCSIGGAVAPLDGGDYDTLFVKADTAVYQAKDHGKNGFALYSPEMEAKSGLVPPGINTSMDRA